jgi:hypothetical protein
MHVIADAKMLEMINSGHTSVVPAEEISFPLYHIYNLFMQIQSSKAFVSNNILHI